MMHELHSSIVSLGRAKAILALASLHVRAMFSLRCEKESEDDHMIIDIKIPESKLAREATELVRQHETEMLFNHSVRVYTVANVIAALVPDYNGLVFAKLLLALAAACFMPAASGYCAAYGGPA
jgi:CO/xanthine dehydrogenase FAD-binding subunit